MVAHFHIQHTNGGNLSLAFLKCLQFTITLLLITNRYWFGYSQNDWRLYRSDFHRSQRRLSPAIHHPTWIHNYSITLYPLVKRNFYSLFLNFEQRTSYILPFCNRIQNAWTVSRLILAANTHSTRCNIQFIPTPQVWWRTWKRDSDKNLSIETI